MPRRIEKVIHVPPNAFSALPHLMKELTQEAYLHGVLHREFRPDLMAIDLAMGIPDAEIARRYGVSEEFVSDFARRNSHIIQSVALNAFAIHAVIRLMVSTKAALFLEDKLHGKIEAEDALRIQAARALLNPMSQVIIEKSDDLVGAIREYVMQKSSQGYSQPVQMSLPEPPPKKSLEEILNERNESQRPDL